MKLSAYGRTELARLRRTTVIPAGTTDWPTDQDRTVRHELVLLSDRTVGKRNVWLKPNGTIDHASGWTRKGKMKAEVFKLGPDAWAERHAQHGYERV